MANELPNTYIVQDRSNRDEMTRLSIQDQMTTQGMGGVLPEQSDPTHFRRILDIGCGTGNWVIETAQTYPSITRLVGIDASQTMLTYARARAKEYQVEDRVEFRAMDALLQLDFPDNSFDLVNERYASSFVRAWEWPKFLSECGRVCRQGGIVRLTELNADMQSSSPALNWLNALFIQASSLAGRAFLSDHWGKTEEVVPLLERHGLTQVQVQEHALVFRAGTEEGQLFIADMTRLYQNIVPYIQKHLRLPDDYQAHYQQALVEMQHADFVATWHVPTTWGTVAAKK
jgi:ubiquinone/menaquinone biosynthesis C-methylase UbiE